MATREEVHETLRLARTCTAAALEAVRDPERFMKTDKRIDLCARLKDLVSLLSLVYQHVTKLAFALKPSSPTFSAALSPAKELATHLDALASCACSIDRNDDGETLVREIRWSIEDVLGAVDSLISVYMSDTHYQQGADVTEGSSKGAPYLVRTAVAHEAIDRARNVPRSNTESVRRKWASNMEGIEDCRQEIQEILEDDAVEKRDGTGDSSSDNGGWDDLLDDPGQASSEDASEKELSRLASAESLLKLTHALFRKIDSILFVPDPPLASLSNRDFDRLLEHASATLRTSDDLVNALYIPQSQEAVAKCVAAFSSSVAGLRRLLESPRPSTAGMPVMQPRMKGETSIQDGMASLVLGGSITSRPAPKESKHAKWLDVCFEQISQISQSLDS